MYTVTPVEVSLSPWVLGCMGECHGSVVLLVGAYWMMRQLRADEEGLRGPQEGSGLEPAGWSQEDQPRGQTYQMGRGRDIEVLGGELVYSWRRGP